MATRTKLAIFDIDGTIFRSSLIIELFNELVRRGVYPQSASRVVERNYLAWLNRKGHYNDYLMKLVRVFYQSIAGCSANSVEPAVRTVIRWQRNRVHRYPRQLITDLKRKGYFILVISNSPEPMVLRFASSMGFDAAIGHTLEIRDGVYTGRSIVNGTPHPGIAWMDKVSALKRFIESRKMNVDIAQSIMIGDSEGDVPLLSFVGRPIAFNPSLPLARIARARGWRIVVERKDVVYDIKDMRLVPVSGQSPRVSYGNAGRSPKA
jgi:HAD superfamily hydrolase (TIGR01490 family)